MLFTKCILHKPAPEDGMRISVMSRHTLADGITPDIRITECEFWFPGLGPSPKLIGSYIRKEISWQEFETRYLIEMRVERTAATIRVYARYALRHNITFMCIEETVEFCHRRLLVEECQRYEPSLLVEHR